MAPGEGLRRRARAPEGFRSITRPRLDIGDLRAIETTLRALGEVRLSSEDFEGEVSSVDDFLATGERALDSLTMRSRDKDFQSLEFSFSGGDARLYGNTNDPKIAGLLQQLEQIVRRGSRPWAEKLEWAGKPACTLLAVVTALMAVLVGWHKTTVGVVTLATYAGLALVALILWLWGRSAQGEVLLIRRDEAPGWFVRNRDALIVGVVVGVVGAVVGYVLGRLGR